MSRKILGINHHTCDGCCMWSGIEDIYVTKIGHEVPEAFFFAMSSYCEAAYLKTSDDLKPYMFMVSDGRTKETYGKLKGILGLKYEISEGRTFQHAFKSIKKEIDNGFPVILGPLDMYYLPYLKMYHKVHISMHYVLMIGYDDEKECALIYDCGRSELQELPYLELIKGWQIEKNLIGDKNGFIRFRLPDKLIDEYELAEISLREKAKRQLYEEPEFVGISAYKKIAREFPVWEKELPKEVYKNVVVSLAAGFGMVPKLPNPILGIQEDEKDINYRGCYDRVGNVLTKLGEKYGRENWFMAAKLFNECGLCFEEITDRIVKFYCNNEECLQEVPYLFIQIGNLSEKAYGLLIS